MSSFVSFGINRQLLSNVLSPLGEGCVFLTGASSVPPFLPAAATVGQCHGQRAR